MGNTPALEPATFDRRTDHRHKVKQIGSNAQHGHTLAKPNKKRLLDYLLTADLFTKSHLFTCSPIKFTYPETHQLGFSRESQAPHVGTPQEGPAAFWIVRHTSGLSDTGHPPLTTDARPNKTPVTGIRPTQIDGIGTATR